MKQILLKKHAKTAIFFVCALVLARLALFFAPYKDLDEFQKRPVSTRVLDKDGAILQILPLENGLRREFLPISQIPEVAKKSFLRAEDKRFFWHFGIDIFSLGRAIFQNVRGLSRVSGASTITMQLARMVSPSESRSFGAKLRDSANALRIEFKLSKKRILELYLNNVPFGQNAEGIASAARTFFGKDVRSLDSAQIAVLSVIPRSPSRYSPISNPKNNLEAALKISKNLSKNQIDSALKTARKFEYPFECAHFVRYLRKNGVFKGKSEYKTTIWLPLQKFAEERATVALRSASSSRIANIALCVRDVATDEIRAWSGSGGWSEDNAQIDGVLNTMQPGSSMKPFLYALALESGFSVTDILADVPQEFGDETLYIPQNFNNRFNGPVRFRIALASSLNIPSVKILSEIGEDVYIQKLKEIGFSSLKNGSGESAGLSLALGGGEVSLNELVSAFGIFVRDGILADGTRIFSADTARLICSILSDKNARSLGFGYAQSFETKYPSIFKTGTSNQYQNITALGATKEYSVGVWMGNFSGNTVIGRTGSSLPAKCAKEILDFLEDGVPIENLAFPLPENYERKKICALSGLSPSIFCTEKVFEFVKKGSVLPECSWHTKNETIYPAEYQRWLLVRGSDSEINHASSLLEIVLPKNGGIFYVDESKKRVNQIVRFEAVGGFGKTAEIFLDDEKIADISRPFVFNLPAVLGKHKVSVKSAGEECDVFFEVR